MIRIALLAALMSSQSGEAEPVSPPAFFTANEELRGYLLEAGRNHPGLLARYEEWLAALERVPQVTSLEDPMFTYGQFLQSEANRFRVALAQKFPWFGTLRARGEKAAEEADAALARFYAERNRVFLSVKTAYFEYAFLGKSVQVAESQAEILSYMEETVRSMYALGMASQDDLLRIQIEQAKVKDQYDGFTQYRPALGAQLTAALGRQDTSVPAWPQMAAFPPAAPSAAEVRTRIRATNPDLTELEHMINAQRKQLVLAKKDGLPNFTIGLEFLSVSKPRKIRPDRPYPATLNTLQKLGANARQNRANLLSQLIQGGPISRPTPPAGSPLIDAYTLATSNEPMSYSDGGEDNIALSVQVSVPIWRKRVRGGIEEAKHREAAAQHQRRERALALDAEAEMALFGLQDGRRRLDLYEDSLLPRAQQTYESLQTAYATGATDVGFLDVLDSVQTLLEFQLEQAQAARDLHVAGAELEFLLGGPWNDMGGASQ